ncbi:MAG: type VI secretion system baseplate subunit TssE [Myxococcales bacterium]|nr:type VI secretion system baseplate subunit TssE [Myxococcales bacterium]
MARAQGEQVLRSSVLDRVSGSASAGGTFGSIGLRELKRAVTRDLDRLLNTRVWWPGEFEGLEEAAKSILTYGIPDLSSYSWSSSDGRSDICRCIETAVKTFEPRLLQRTVKVAVVETDAKDDFRVRLRIDAVLHVEPYTEPVSFDTDIEVDTGAVEVRGAA